MKQAKFRLCKKGKYFKHQAKHGKALKLLFFLL